jgi:hypothetical protein
LITLPSSLTTRPRGHLELPPAHGVDGSERRLYRSEHRHHARRGTPFRWNAEPPPLPAWLSEADVDFYTNEFTRTGFRGGLNWYRNICNTIPG